MNDNFTLEFEIVQHPESGDCRWTIRHEGIVAEGFEHNHSSAVAAMSRAASTVIGKLVQS